MSTPVENMGDKKKVQPMRKITEVQLALEENENEDTDHPTKKSFVSPRENVTFGDRSGL